MNRIALAASLALAACSPTASTGTTHVDPLAPGEKGDQTAPQELPVQMGPPTPGWFTQQIDHPSDGSASPGTFAQRYWYSTEFARSATSPVIFYLCGEAACDPWYATTMADSAQALGASVVVLEHRFYGQSMPYRDYELDHLQYLNIHNALEDAAAFERWAKVELPLAGKWIVVGGSYPGMLAAFYREQHPELVVGAWASSAPVEVSLSFWGYDEIVNAALGEDCASLFRIALGAAEDAWDDPAQRDVTSQQLFGGPAQGTLADFLRQVSQIAEVAAQYGNQASLCAQLAQVPDQPLQGVVAYAAAGAQPRPTTLGPSRFMPPTVAPDDANSQSDGVMWFYQVCSELGFFQTHSLDQGNSIMSWLIDEDYWTAVCQGFSGMEPAVDATRATYYQPIHEGRVSNLFFVNGTLDPWSALSYQWQEQAPDGVTVSTVVGGSHCSDLYNLQPDSNPDVAAAHQTFQQLAAGWLQ
jgi:pimeloyl-ACP methyl ester carboxylesterase